MAEEQQRTIRLFGHEYKIYKEENFLCLDLSLGIPGTRNLNSKVTCAGIHQDLTEDGTNIKKMRSFRNEEGVEENQTRVRTELTLYTDYTWTIEKTLTESDVGHLTRLMLETKEAVKHIMNHLSADVQQTIQQGNKFNVKVYDHDTDSEHNMVFLRYVTTSKSYVFNGGWGKDFVRRRSLKQGDRIGLFWGFFDSRLHFRVLQRKNLIS